MQEMQIQSLGGEDPLEKEMATHPSVLAWEIPWTEEVMASHDVTRARHDLVTKQKSPLDTPQIFYHRFHISPVFLLFPYIDPLPTSISANMVRVVEEMVIAYTHSIC